MLYGVDVSKWQKGFNLADAKKAGFDKAIIKAGGGDNVLYKDSQFDNFYNQAVSNKMLLGAYFFGYAFSEEQAKKEANYFISLLQGKDIHYVFYDVEAKMLNQGYSHLTNIIKAFCDTMKNAGYECGIYTSESHFNTKFDDKQLKDYLHWVARYSTSAPKLNSGASIDIWQYGGEVNYLRSNKIAGYTVDQNQIFHSFGINYVVGGKVEGTTHELALQVLDGKWGNGQDRRENLGSRYNEVQAEVEKILKERQAKPVEKTIDELAIEVLAGVYGNGITRRIKLGKKYDAVQKRVEEIIAQRKQTQKKYVVVKGDTLSSIAKRYNTTYKKLAEINKIQNPNLIKVGQEIIIG